MAEQTHDLSTRSVVIGVLGAIGSGKSAVSDWFAQQGARVLDADEIAHVVLNSTPVRKRLTGRYGSHVVADGNVVRSFLAERVFPDAAELAWLESVVHPRVRAALAAGVLAGMADPRCPAIVLDVPLLIEASPLRKNCDLLIFVDSSVAIRRQRVRDGRGWSKEELARRELQQLSPEEKRARADVVFDNNGTLEQLRASLSRWLQQQGGFSGLPRSATATANVRHLYELREQDSSGHDNNEGSGTPERV